MRRKRVMPRGREPTVAPPCKVRLKNGTMQERSIIQAIPICGPELKHLLKWFKGARVEGEILGSYVYELWPDGLIAVSKDGGRTLEEAGRMTKPFYKKVQKWVKEGVR